MTIRDWSGLPPDRLAPHYARERESWLQSFGWDSGPQWRIVEQARTTWGLPGLIACDDDDRLLGWLYYLETPDGPQLGGVTAPDATTATQLVQAFRVRTASRPVTGFLPDLAPGLLDACASAGLRATIHPYLVHDLTTPSTPTPTTLVLRPWQDGVQDRDLAAAVLREAYDPADGRLFAPGGTQDEWRRYVDTLVDQIGCGQFDAGLSRIAFDGNRAVGVAIVTGVGPGVAHLAQIATRRECQGRGVGQALLSAVEAAAFRQGRGALSLMVSARNQAALRFYARAGFTPRGRFLDVTGEPLSLAG